MVPVGQPGHTQPISYSTITVAVVPVGQPGHTQPILYKVKCCILSLHVLG